MGTRVRQETEALKAEADMTWDGQARRGQARRAHVILFGLGPFVVMVDGAAGGTYREQSWAEWSTVVPMTGGRPSAGGIGNGNERERIHFGLRRSSYSPTAVVGSEPAHDHNTTSKLQLPPAQNSRIPQDKPILTLGPK